VDYYSNRLRIGRLDEGYYHDYNTMGPYTDASWGNIVEIDSNTIAFTCYAYSQSSFYFIDTLLSLKTTSPFWYALSYMQGNTGICVTPSKKIFGTGVIYSDTANSSNHWFFMTENVPAFLSTISGLHQVPPGNYIKDIMVYPNPFNQKLHINLPVKDGSFKISIFRITGKKILETTISESTTLDTESFSSGAYMVHVTCGTNRSSFKVVKIAEYR
jgi:hypothetical protein